MRHRTPEPRRLFSYLTLAALPPLALGLLSARRSARYSAPELGNAARTPACGASSRWAIPCILPVGSSAAAPIAILGDGPGASRVPAPGVVQIVDAHGRVVLCAQAAKSGGWTAAHGVSLMNTGAAVMIDGHSFPVLVVRLSRCAVMSPGQKYALEQMSGDALQPGYMRLDVRELSAPRGR